MVIEKTLPTLLAERAKSEANTVALRQKHLGIWNEISWGQYLENVEKLAVSLSEQYDFRSGETVAIIGENRPQWLYAHMAVQSIGGVVVGVYQESLPDQIKFYLNDCKARIVIVEDQEQVDKLLEVENELPLVEHIIYYNKQGLRHYQHTKLTYMGQLLKNGEDLLKQKTDFLANQLKLLHSEMPAIISYSAATSGRPKGVILTHHNLIESAKNLSQVDEMKKADDYISFLPLSWVHEHVMSIIIPLIVGMVVNFPERPHTVIGDLREIGPHTLLATPRVFQSLMANFQIRMEGASWFKRKLYNFFKKYGDKQALFKLDKKQLSLFDKMMYTLGDIIMFSAIRDHLGLARIKRAYIAGAAIQTDAFHFYHSIGVNLKQTYGGTEVSGIAFVQYDSAIKAGSSGVPIPNTKVRIGDDGTVYLKNNAIFSEYLNEEDKKIMNDGWLSLGDKGYLDDDGHLFILDRQENVITSSEGEQIYPQLIENKLKSSPYIQEAICFGKNKPYLTAILNIDINSVGRWADKNQIIYTEYSELSVKSEILNLVEGEVRKLMNELPSNERIKKFVILNKQFTADQGELTRTFKVRRNFVEKKYEKIIKAMYSTTLEVPLSASHNNVPNEISSLQIVQLSSGEEVAFANDILLPNAH
ncbi:AMP-binding protein [Lysinibacillus telephonicus]|uniref:Acyl-CoA synthetase n=1 Tax=Lysinibacillus telephonicus TaxID=1714840 RepID=A0A431UID3_9BACI|nr:AMP-binding protein [Lysinibacillus telephonicus]RTQ89165.1 long-chain fatty acid--CoA ligase [Lysinibacillus telephonicus]